MHNNLIIGMVIGAAAAAVTVACSKNARNAVKKCTDGIKAKIDNMNGPIVL